MNLTPLEAISPVDGRYRRQTAKLADYFSEAALIKYRMLVEVEYFIALCRLPLPQLKGFDHRQFERLRDLYRSFSMEDAQRIKEIEKITLSVLITDQAVYQSNMPFSAAMAVFLVLLSLALVGLSALVGRKDTGS